MSKALFTTATKGVSAPLVQAAGSGGVAPLVIKQAP